MNSGVKFVTFPTRDNFPTQGHLYEAKEDNLSAPIVMIGPATSVPGSYYGNFGSWLSSEHALTTLIIDYRYSGISFPKGVNFRDKKALHAAVIDAKETTTSRDWREDLRAAFQFVRERYPGKSISYVGHSVGAHLLPIVQIPQDKVIRVLFVGAFAPYHGYHPTPQQKLDERNWAIMMARKEGVFPSSKLKLGQDIPAGCGIEWMQWSSHPRYMARDFPTEYDAYTGRILSLIFTDDVMCHHPARHAADKILHTLPQAESTRIEIDPVERGWGPVGHIKAFGVDHKDDLWKGMLLWIKYGEFSPELQGDRWDSGTSEYGPSLSSRWQATGKM